MTSRKAAPDPTRGGPLGGYAMTEHEHWFPVGPADHNGDHNPDDCTCGMTYQQYDAEMGERIAEALEALTAARATRQPATAQTPTQEA